MELYIANEATGEQEEILRCRLEREGMDAIYRPEWPAASSEQVGILDAILSKNGYERLDNNPLYKIKNPCDKNILIYCPCEVARNLFFHLWNLEKDYIPEHFGAFPAGAISRYAFQNYEQGYTSARCLYLNDRR